MDTKTAVDNGETILDEEGNFNKKMNIWISKNNSVTLDYYTKVILGVTIERSAMKIWELCTSVKYLYINWNWWVGAYVGSVRAWVGGCVHVPYMCVV